MSNRATLAETLDQLLTSAATPEKLAEAATPIKRVVEAPPEQAGLRKLAEALQSADLEDATALTFEDVHGVKTAYAEETLASTEGLVGFRRLGQELLIKAAEIGKIRQLKSAHVVRAAKGLTILRDKVRGL